MRDRTKPPPIPRPTPPPPRAAGAVDSERGMRAAGLMRPRAQSNPDLSAAANAGLLLAAVRKLSEGQAAHENTFKALAYYHERTEGHDRAQDLALVVLARALGVQDQLPPQITQSSPPPAASKGEESKPPPKPKLETIETDSVRAKVAAYALLVCTVAKIAWDVFHGGH